MRRLWSYVASPVGIVMYAKHFMSEFPKELQWVQIFRTDNTLMNRYLKFDAELGYDGLPSHSPNPNTGKRQSSSSSNSSSSPTKGQGGAKRTKGGGQKQDSNPKSKLFCNSRMDPSMGDCSFHPCRFCHLCPIHAGESHTAKECMARGTWDQGKADAAKEARRNQ
jgi:hypothetical protein